MGNTSFRLVPKIEGNKIGIFLVVPSMGQSRQVAYLEVPDDCQFLHSFLKTGKWVGAALRF